MERKEEKKSGLGDVLIAGGIIAGVAAIGYGLFKMLDDSDDSDKRRERIHQTYSQANQPPTHEQRQQQVTYHQQPVSGQNLVPQQMTEIDDRQDEEELPSWIDQIDIESEYLCPISNSFMMRPYMLTSCGHTFEKAEIQLWLRHKNQCPVCKKYATANQLVQNFSMKSVQEKELKRLKELYGDEQ